MKEPKLAKWINDGVTCSYNQQRPTKREDWGQDLFVDKHNATVTRCAVWLFSKTLVRFTRNF
jgi:hypothetical protein